MSEMTGAINRLNEIEALVQAATPGPWGYDMHFTVMRIESGEYERSIFQLPCGLRPIEKVSAEDRANMEFGASARTDVPDLLKLVRVLLDERNAARAVLSLGEMVIEPEAALDFVREHKKRNKASEAAIAEFGKGTQK